MYRKRKTPTVFQQIEDQKQYTSRIVVKRRTQLETRLQECQEILAKCNNRTQIRQMFNAQEEMEEIKAELATLSEQTLKTRLEEMQQKCTSSIKPQMIQEVCLKRKTNPATFKDLMKSKTQVVKQDNSPRSLERVAKKQVMAVPGNQKEMLRQRREKNELESMIVDWSMIRVDYRDRDRCPMCETLLIQSVIQGTLICKNGCGFTAQDIETLQPTHNLTKAPPQRAHSTKDSNLDDLLAHFEPDDYVILQKELEEITRKDMKMHNPFHEGPISTAYMKKVLKKHNKPEYYPNRCQLTGHMNGEPFPTMDDEKKNLIRTMVNMTKLPFQKYKGERNNSLSRGLVFHGICSILGMKEYPKYFPLLKSGPKLAKQIEIFLNICGDNGWPQYFEFQ